MVPPLEDSEELQQRPLLHHVLDSLPAPVLRVDAAGLLISISPAAEQLFEIHASDVLGSPANWLLEACSRQVFEPDTSQTMCLAATGWALGVHGHRVPARRSSGEPVQLSISTFFTGASEAPQLLILLEDLGAQTVDIAAVSENASRFQTLTRLAPVGILELDSTWCCKYANDKWCELSRLGVEESLDTGWVDAMHPDDVSAALIELHGAVSRLESCEHELRLQTPLGEVTWVSLNATGLFDRSQRIKGILVVATDITERYQTGEELRRLAMSDALTGLKNRQAFLEQLHVETSSITRSSELALMYLDLDGFKAVNDTLGHHAGDTLLKSVAERLNQLVRRGDTVARLGGDEFTIILPRQHAAQSADHIASRMVESIKEPFLIDGQQVHISASIGIAISNRHVDSDDVLVRQADVALYRAKRSGRAQHVFFSPELDRARQDHSVLISRLSSALDSQEFKLHYQPQIDVVSGKLVGFEALLRWPESTFPEATTEEYILALEDNGLIGPVGDWVLENACKDWQSWRDAGLIPDDMRMSVNVSARQLAGKDFLPRVAKTLHECAMPAGQVIIELTESAAISSFESGVISDLKRLGVSISIDDFGTGFSSLAYLGRLPVDEIKIDKSFIKDMRNKEQATPLVEGILALARSLGLNVVAEGVEDAEVLPTLAAAGCATYQGYLFSRPMCRKSIVALLSQQNNQQSLTPATSKNPEPFDTRRPASAPAPSHPTPPHLGGPSTEDARGTSG